MDRNSIRRRLLSPSVGVAFLAVLAAFFGPPLLTGGQLLYDSLAAPLWDVSVATGAALGCGSMSCIPLMLAVFVGYTYLLAVLAAGVGRVGVAAVRSPQALRER